jgi:hypothetical protein
VIAQRTKGFTIFAAIAMTHPAAAHHSEAGFDLESLLTLEGTVTEFEWRNPHVYLSLDTVQENGEALTWVVQTSSTVSLMRRGWTPETLAVGDRVALTANPTRDGRLYAVLDELLTINDADAQTVLSNGSSGVTVDQPDNFATTIEGRWLTDRSRLGGFPGGLDELTSEQLVLTDEARAIQATFDESAEVNPELRCVGRPTPAMFVNPNYLLEIELDEAEDLVYIRGQYMDQERVVYMDGRTHPPPTQRFHEGHSTGTWEGDTLVVDTANFTDHPSPYQNGIPSGAQKHVVERLTLTDEGRRLIVEFILDDPQYIAEPFQYAREFLYSPEADMSPFDCDLESTRRFVPE